MKFQVTRTSGTPKPEDGCQAREAKFHHKESDTTRAFEWHEKEFSSFEELLSWMDELKETEVVISRYGGWDHWDRLEGPEPPEADIEIYDDYRE